MNNHHQLFEFQDEQIHHHNREFQLNCFGQHK